MLKRFLLVLGVISRLALGYGVRWAANSWFDSLLYPVVIARFGMVCGGLVMTIFSVPLNIVTISLYDRTAKDWLLLRDLQKWSLFIEKLSARSLVLGVLARIVVFFVFCWDDPVTVVVYFRGWEYTGLKKRDWIIFVLATIVSNAYWTIRWAVVFGGAKFIWTWFWGL